MNDLCVDIGWKSINHYGEQLCGDHVDVVDQGENSQVIVLVDGLGSGVKANILGADTRNIDGRAFGTMLLGLPEDETQVAKAMAYIRSQKDITVEEVPDYHE